MKSKGNTSWKGFSILLIIVNLVFYAIILAWGYEMLVFYLALLIIDIKAISSYRKNQSPPWKTLSISLLAMNVIFVSFSGYIATHQGHTEDLSGLGVFFTAIPVGIIDLAAIISYRITQEPQGTPKKIILYATLIPWLVRSLSSACVHAAFSSIPCESALSSRASESTKRQ